MAYCTQQDLIDRFGETELVQLTDRTNKPATTIDTVVVGRHLDDATALIDGYLARAYQLPLSATSPMLVKVGADLARYFIHGKAAPKDHPVELAHRQALAWLRQVAEGIVVLDANGLTPASAGTNEVLTNQTEREQTLKSWQGYV